MSTYYPCENDYPCDKPNEYPCDYTFPGERKQVKKEETKDKKQEHEDY